jgi:hypothetical protein
MSLSAVGSPDRALASSSIDAIALLRADVFRRTDGEGLRLRIEPGTSVRVAALIIA